MQFNVFVSHSMRPEDMPLITSFCDYIAQHGMTCYLAERDWKFGQTLALKIENAITNCDCVIAFLTVSGSSSSYVNQEIGLARGKGKLCIPVIEKGVNLKGLQVGSEYIELDRANPASCATTLAEYLMKLRADKEQRAAIGWAALALLAALAMRT